MLVSAVGGPLDYTSFQFDQCNNARCSIDGTANVAKMCRGYSPKKNVTDVGIQSKWYS